jgi:hypothetical protein
LLLASEPEAVGAGFAFGCVAAAKYDDLSITSGTLRRPGPARLIGRGGPIPTSAEGDIIATDLEEVGSMREKRKGFEK